MWYNAVFTSYQTGASGQSQHCVIHPSIPTYFHLHPLSDSFSPCASFFSSIWAFQLPFRPQKYDVCCSNDLQTISGNAHHESWKCIFPFPLWRRLHAHREIYTVIAFSFSASFSFPLLHPPSVLCWPPHASHSFSCSTHFYSSCFCISCLPVKANRSPAMCMSWTPWWVPLSFSDVSIWLVYKSITDRIPILTPRGIHILNWINARRLCELRMCAAACLTVVMLDYSNYGIAVWNTRLQSLQHNTRFSFQSV